MKLAALAASMVAFQPADTVLYSYLQDDSIVAITDGRSSYCGTKMHRASHETDNGYAIDGCWEPGEGESVKVFLFNGTVLVVPKENFLKAEVLPCDTDMVCEEI